MDYGMISQIEKARRYADEPNRITFNAFTLTFKGDNANYDVALTDDGWQCTCPGYQKYSICPHLMALERMFKPMLKRTPLQYATGQNVVSDVEKAARYADEPDRIQLKTFKATFHGTNNEHVVTYDNGNWTCDSMSFQLRGVCSHTMALERLFKGMVIPVAVPAES